MHATEKRVAPDGKKYTKREFMSFYGNYQRWDAAAPRGKTVASKTVSKSSAHRGQAAAGAPTLGQSPLVTFGDVDDVDEYDPKSMELLQGKRVGIAGAAEQWEQQSIKVSIAMPAEYVGKLAGKRQETKIALEYRAQTTLPPRFDKVQKRLCTIALPKRDLRKLREATEEQTQLPKPKPAGPDQEGYMAVTRGSTAQQVTTRPSLAAMGNSTMWTGMNSEISLSRASSASSATSDDSRAISSAELYRSNSGSSRPVRTIADETVLTRTLSSEFAALQA